jgi:NAD(P)-dependent dehydrogenase (short-subunit alcohol dehydrogenase family)
MGVVIVTGSARGIGAGVARYAGANGWAVCVNYINSADSANAVVSDIEASGGRAISVQADVSEEEQVEHLFEEAIQRLGPVTGLVNNAGIMGGGGPVDEMDANTVRRLFDVNVIGPMLCTKVAIKRMGRSHGGNGGAIVNISSPAAIHGGIGSYVDFAASKAALDRYTSAAAQEQAHEGIRINGLRPGLVMTEGNQAWSDEHPDWLPSIVEQLPIGREAEMNEIAAAAMWLLSENSSYVVGTVMDVSGGFAIR